MTQRAPVANPPTPCPVCSALLNESYGLLGYKSQPVTACAHLRQLAVYTRRHKWEGGRG
jgi:hypothetical protein